MPRILAIHWNQQQAQAVVVNSRASGTMIEAARTVPLGKKSVEAEIGEQLAATLAPYRHGRCQTIVGMDREQLQWQALALPPAPANEVPDLVHLQAARNMSLADAKMGLDFLSFSGDEQTPHEVLAMGIDSDRLAKIHQVAATAGLKIDRLVPVESGWVAIVHYALAQQLDDASKKSKLRLFAALQSDRAILWATLQPRATSQEQVILFRSLRMPALGLTALEMQDRSAPDLAATWTPIQTLASHLKRTVLALQTSHPYCPVTEVWLAGDRPRTAELQELGQQLELPIDFIDCYHVLPQPPEEFAPWAFPLAGLALDAAHRRAPLVDLVHPHRAITTQSNRRTYVLLATALACLLAWAAWLGYQNLRLPQQAAEAANRQASLLQQTGNTDRTDQQLAAALGRWSAGQVDLLDQLRQLSVNLRPRSFDAEDFSANEDLILIALNMQRQSFELDAVATNLDAVGAFEARLRADHYLVQRDNTNQKSAWEDYGWPFRVSVQLPQPSAASQEDTRP